jgi:hypothetical protein
MKGPRKLLRLMLKPKSWFSLVTTRQCRCNALDAYCNPSAGFGLIKRHGEYRLLRLSDTSGDSYLVFYYCPFCGGMFGSPSSHKPKSQIPAQERHRLNVLLSQLESIDDALAKLGVPNYDTLRDAGVHDSNLSEALEMGTTRSLLYTNMSDIANVLILQRKGDRIGIALIPKV